MIIAYLTMLTHPNVNLAANLLAECTVVADNIRRVVIIPQGFTGVVEDNALAKMFGNSETPIVASNGVCQAFLDSVDWVRKQSDTNHCAILVLRRRFKVIALLLGYSAPLVVLRENTLYDRDAALVLIIHCTPSSPWDGCIYRS